jgi:hypothetical protein
MLVAIAAGLAAALTGLAAGAAAAALGAGKSQDFLLDGGIGGWNIAAIHRECTYAPKTATLPEVYHCIE